MKDQYGNKVPKDLVVLDINPGDLTEKEMKRVTQARWYEVRSDNWPRGSPILVSFKESGGISETDPLDASIDLSDRNTEIFYINDVLKRWSPEDWWYHA